MKEFILNQRLFGNVTVKGDVLLGMLGGVYGTSKIFKIDLKFINFLRYMPRSVNLSLLVRIYSLFNNLVYRKYVIRSYIFDNGYNSTYPLLNFHTYIKILGLDIFLLQI